MFHSQITEEFKVGLNITINYEFVLHAENLHLIPQHGSLRSKNPHLSPRDFPTSLPDLHNRSPQKCS